MSAQFIGLIRFVEMKIAFKGPVAASPRSPLLAHPKSAIWSFFLLNGQLLTRTGMYLR